MSAKELCHLTHYVLISETPCVGNSLSSVNLNFFLSEIIGNLNFQQNNLKICCSYKNSMFFVQSRV